MKPVDVGKELQPLMTLLGEELAVIRALIEAATAKRDALLAQDPAAVEQVVVEETQLLDRIAALEDARATWLLRWASDHSLPEVKTVSDILRVLGGEKGTGIARMRARRLKEAADRLMAAVETLDEINRTNASLLYHSVAYVHNLLQALQGEEPGTRLYGPAPASRRHGGTPALKEWRV